MVVGDGVRWVDGGVGGVGGVGWVVRGGVVGSKMKDLKYVKFFHQIVKK